MHDSAKTIPCTVECDFGNGHKESGHADFYAIAKKVIIRNLQGNVLQVLENCSVQELRKFVRF